MANGQTRNELWLKLNLTHAFHAKWSVGIDLQHRRQADFQSGDKNIFHYPLGNYARLWLYYKMPKKWALTISPAGYFHNEEIVTQNGALKKTNELRVSAGIIKEWAIHGIKNKNRFLYDARFNADNRTGQFFQSRYRLQNSLAVPFLKKHIMLSYLVSNEVLIKKETGHTSFDQNRIYQALQYKTGITELNAGYQCIIQKGAAGRYQRNQLFIMLNIMI